jgi:hypothetical protein
MADEDEHLAYGNDSVAEEKSNYDNPRSPQPEPEIVTESTAQLEEAKAHKITEACRRRDIEGLQALAESPGGFIRNELRQQACKLCDLFFVFVFFSCPDPSTRC